MKNKQLSKAKIRLVLKRLSELYPDAGPELNFSNPYETLVATMLSAQSTDNQVNKVTPEVFRQFPTIASMAKATPEILYPYVKSCGFASKATNIVLACRQIMDEFAGAVPGDMDKLISLPGVGRKTANVVLANAFHVPTIAVDTHVFRVSNRLGLADATNVSKTEQQLMQIIPRKDWIAAHHWLILHGRRVCKARRPLCEICTLNDLCNYYK
ncbi:MAG: endonuclease III, partial [Clostridiales bacterium]|nr:endonuclease III [Clostridiales bacterium]